MQSNSPHVYVPAADSKDRRNAKRNITVLSNRARKLSSSAVVVTTNEVKTGIEAADMQPLIANPNTEDNDGSNALPKDSTASPGVTNNVEVLPLEIQLKPNNSAAHSLFPVSDVTSHDAAD